MPILDFGGHSMVSTPLLKLSLCTDNVEMKYIEETWRFDVQICNLSLDLRWIFWVCSMQICMRLLCVLRRFVCVLCTTPSFSLWFSTGMCGRFSNYARWVLEDRFEWILCWIVPPIDNYAEAPMESRIMPQIVLASGGRPKAIRS